MTTIRNSNILLQTALLRAIATLIEKDVYLLEVDANERTITHKLAGYLQMELPELDVDAEYNRTGKIPKRLKECPEYHAKQEVYPDIVVHKRGKKENHLIIEVKKGLRTDAKYDICKLRAYKVELGYEHAALVKFPHKIDQLSYIPEIQWDEWD
jgi:hypothetical protein